MASISSSSAAPQQPSFYDVNMLEQECVLNDLENASGRSNIVMPPPPPPAPFDAAQQPTFAPPHQAHLPACSLYPNLHQRVWENAKLKEPSVFGKSVKSSHVTVPQAFQQMGLDICNLNATFGIAVNTLQERTSYSITHSVDPIPLH
ncbi:hypothetical protein DFJ58DRAFT_727562 [Suillus subalutaceus]|uniref:uncharacterized protein n=1 Tax=Suillus subalutaceus TaxID=48586 RepID=UPI001B87D89F|nr:uncharacterized protein DFJ58DRAFT_727562 [Suillus subalutaceus]KAG1855358.1 hypothetical protein DFJ58DRAFT_727562 [Suillus subalutaceus]